MGIRLTLVVFAALALQAGELELKPETLQAWDAYVHKAAETMQQRLHRTGPFLQVDGNADLATRVRAGEIVVWPIGETNPKRVPAGLIHDWVAAAFISGVRIDDVLSVARDYARYKEVYKPGVLDAKLLTHAGDEDRFSMLMRNRSFFSKTTLDGQYDSSYIQIDDKRWYSVSRMTRVQEIEYYGQTKEHRLPPDEGHGYIWRMQGFSHLEERDGGVYVDEELIALSRDVPVAIRCIADPIIRRVARESLALSIEKTRAAVERVNVNAKRPNGNDGSGNCAQTGCVAYR